MDGLATTFWLMSFLFVSVAKWLMFVCVNFVFMSKCLYMLFYLFFFLCGCVQYLNPLNLLNWLLDFTEIIAEGIQNYYIFFFKNEYESTECKPLSLSQNNMILNEKHFTFL